MTRRAIHDERYWADHLAKHPASGLTLREYCRREGIEVHQFYYWRKRTAGSTIERQPAAVERRSVSISSPNKNEHDGKTVVIQMNDRTSVSIPAQMHDTIEAVLRMAQRLGDQESAAKPSSGFRSVVVR
jgi:hypothetical protein